MLLMPRLFNIWQIHRVMDCTEKDAHCTSRRRERWWFEVNSSAGWCCVRPFCYSVGFGGCRQTNYCHCGRPRGIPWRKNYHHRWIGDNTATPSKVESGWTDELDWILPRKLVLLEHFALLINCQHNSADTTYLFEGKQLLPFQTIIKKLPFLRTIYFNFGHNWKYTSLVHQHNMLITMVCHHKHRVRTIHIFEWIFAHLHLIWSESKCSGGQNFWLLFWGNKTKVTFISQNAHGSTKWCVTKTQDVTCGGLKHKTTCLADREHRSSLLGRLYNGWRFFTKYLAWGHFVISNSSNNPIK